jgi:hypothetical protein
MSTLGKNLVKVPDVQAAAKEGCGKAGDAVNNAADTVKNAGEDIGNGLKGAFGFKDRREPAVGDVLEDVCNKGAEVANQAVQLTADVINKAAGSIAKAIGIKEYYSVHIGVLCYGDYKPDFKDKDAKPDVKECSPKFKAEKTDLSKTLDEELQVGPFKFKLSDLDLVDSIQDAFDLIPRALAAMSFFFLFAALALIVGFLITLAILALEYKMRGMQKFALLGGLGTLGLGWLLSLIGVVGLTIVAEKVKDAVNKNGDKFGMSAATSPGMYFLLWASLFFSTAAFAVLFFVWWRNRSGKGVAANEGYAEKNQSGSSMEYSHGFYQEPVGGGQQPQQGQY